MRYIIRTKITLKGKDYYHLHGATHKMFRSKTPYVDDSFFMEHGYKSKGAAINNMNMHIGFSMKSNHFPGTTQEWELLERDI